jgi:hypothetical protein
MRSLILSKALVIFLCGVNGYAKLNREQKICFEEFLKEVTLQKIAKDSLSEADQRLLDSGILYEDAPAEMEHAVKNFANAFVQVANHAGIALSADENFLGDLLLKNKIDMQSGTIERPTSDSSDGEIRLYAYAQLPIDDKRKLYRVNFLANPAAAEAVFAQCAAVYASLLAEFGRIPDTKEAKDETASNYLNARLAEFKYVFFSAKADLKK